MLYRSKSKLEDKKKQRIAARYDLSGKPTTEEKVRQLLYIKSNWRPILEECLIVSKEQKGKDGKFAGAWVMNGLRTQGITPPNNLRTLSSIGLIKLAGTARGGKRAYYTIPDLRGLSDALRKLNS